jgi:hypothetical protein
MNRRALIAHGRRSPPRPCDGPHVLLDGCLQA